MILSSSDTKSNMEHINDAHDIYITSSIRLIISNKTPLLFVERKPGLHSCKNPDCIAKNCDMPMVALLVEQGANPYIYSQKEAYGNGHHLSLSSHIDLCEAGRALLGLQMYERVKRHRILVVLALQKARQLQGHGSFLFPEEVLTMISKHAGIGEQIIMDAKTPWIPTMPQRTSDPLCQWYGAYTMVDAAIARGQAHLAVDAN